MELQTNTQRVCVRCVSIIIQEILREGVRVYACVHAYSGGGEGKGEGGRNCAAAPNLVGLPPMKRWSIINEQGLYFPAMLPQETLVSTQEANQEYRHDGESNKDGQQKSTLQRTPDRQKPSRTPHPKKGHKKKGHARARCHCPTVHLSTPHPNRWRGVI